MQLLYCTLKISFHFVSLLSFHNSLSSGISLWDYSVQETSYDPGKI